MGYAKKAMAWMGQNLARARKFAAGHPETIGSISKYAMVGAGLGAVRGAADNLVGQDRVSILGGAMQGAVTLGGLRGMKIGLNKGMAFMNNKAAPIAAAAAKGKTRKRRGRP